MKKYFYIFILFLFFFPYSAIAGSSCDFPLTMNGDFPSLKKIEKEVFKYKGYLVFIYYYDIAKSPHRDEYASFHFKNIIRLAEKDLKLKKNMDINDYWDKNGRAIPYILLELGGTVIDDQLYTMKKYIKIGTCFDRQGEKEKNIYYIENGSYGQIMENIKKVFIPVLAIEDRLESKK